MSAERPSYRGKPFRKLLTYISLVVGGYVFLSLIYLAAARVLTGGETESFRNALGFLILLWMILLFPLLIFAGVLLIDIAMVSEGKIVTLAEVLVGLSISYVVLILAAIIVHDLWFVLRPSDPLIFYSFILALIFVCFYLFKKREGKSIFKRKL